jgi:hypothetical protein
MSDLGASTTRARAIDAAIEDAELAFKELMEWQDDITIRQFRRLKMMRFKLANFIVATVKPDGQPEKDE